MKRAEIWTVAATASSTILPLTSLVVDAPRSSDCQSLPRNKTDSRQSATSWSTRSPPCQIDTAEARRQTCGRRYGSYQPRRRDVSWCWRTSGRLTTAGLTLIVGYLDDRRATIAARSACAITSARYRVEGRLYAARRGKRRNVKCALGRVRDSARGVARRG